MPVMSWMTSQILAIWAVAQQQGPLPQSPGFWQRSRRGNSEWCNSARGPNTLFSPSDVDYVRGDAALLHWLKAGLEHTSGCGQDWLHAARALTQFQLHPHEEALGIKYRFLVITTDSVTSQLRAVDGSAVITFWIYVWRIIDAVGSFVKSRMKK